MTEAWQHFAAALLAGDERQAYSLLADDPRPSIRVYKEIITPAMYDIGEKWLRNEITVADEHLATSVCDFALAQYIFPFKRINKQSEDKAMFLCLEEEQHVIGSKMVAALFEEQHWQVRHLGPNLPLAHALSSAEEWRPKVIGLSAAIPYRIPALKEYIAAFEQLPWKPKIMVGGRVVSMHDIRPYCGRQTQVIYDLDQVAGWLNELAEEQADGVR
ncbi:cobalamin B12-binding domain-containing protein [Terribacillus halophilus]|jgi:MerR family transcriptional regulator, light-induced transcriptional regulator|uniref:cobalamin B12-binding domain-containing protein n=1 Tax=Terribacillus halophilus TaxID=361279 RepID=UPI0009879308|nr:cobalamin B12-binding domain-containing protein [Terribacillus halophilus]